MVGVSMEVDVSTWFLCHISWVAVSLARSAISNTPIFAHVSSSTVSRPMPSSFESLRRTLDGIMRKDTM
jgi:hypothetical protein